MPSSGAIVLVVGGVTVATIVPEQYPTAQALTDRISGVPGFATAMVPGSELLSSVTALDFFGATDVKTAIGKTSSTSDSRGRRDERKHSG